MSVYKWRSLFYVAAVLNGFILMFQRWRLDPILQVSQLLLVEITGFYKVESIYLRY
ncbi:Ycf66 family protein [Nostoc sp. T09]|uniref:Ycf66 family protein n=1 Tax=Nostoc sp. T09 TaxID=1932621 RepID=UPI00356B629F